MALAGELRITPARLGLACLLHQGPDILPIPGTRRADRVDQNAAAAGVVLDAATLAPIDALVPPGLAAGATLLWRAPRAGTVSMSEVVRGSESSPSPTSARDNAIDVLRASCILYIVGYWHLFGYTPTLFGYANIYTEALKDIALGTFVLVSGLLLSRRPLALNARDVWGFYARRVARIYPLYLLALLLFLLTGFATLREVVAAALLVSMFTPPPLHTLWFMTMIMFFYLLAPVLINIATDARKLIALGCALLLLLVLWNAVVHPIDPRMLQYFPTFVLGMLYQRSAAFRAGLVRYRWLLLLPAALALSLSLARGPVTGALLRVPLVALGALLFYVYASRYLGDLQSRVIAFLSYASFAIYLFHRPVFETALDLYTPACASHEALFLMAVAMPVAIAVAYLLQKSYDRGVTAISAKR